MIELLSFDRIQEILVLIVPGFVSLRMWTLVNPTARLKPSDYLLTIIVYSALNFSVLWWLIAVTAKSSLGLRVVVNLGVLVVAPAAWPLLLRMILSWKRLRPYILDPTPLAWDHYFRKGEPCFVLVHLKNGNYIGGRYSDESYASSYPEPQELYLSEVWRVDGEGRFVEKIESTKGVLVNNDIIEYLEFYYQGGNSDEEQQAKEPRHERVSRA